MTIKTTKYGLKHKKSGKLLGFFTSSNDGAGFCQDVSFTLHLADGETIWYAESPEHAEWVKNNPTPWYNAVYETPNHEFKANELSVVKINIRIEEEELDVKLPTFKEFAKWSAERSGNKKDYDFYMYQKKQSPKISYSLYDLREMLRNK